MPIVDPDSTLQGQPALVDELSLLFTSEDEAFLFKG